MDLGERVPSSQAELGQNEFNRLSNFIMAEYGIKMPPEKKIMLQCRLQKRLRALNLNNFGEYVQYLFSPEGQSEEVIHMMDVVSTNKTDFFRESSHFDFLLSEALPELIENNTLRQLNVWSAGCSSGEEVYTIAITLSEFIQKHSYFNYTVTGSDISTKMLGKAANGIYPEEKIEELPLVLKTRYFLRSKNRSVKKVRVIAELRNKVQFYRQNLLYLPNVYKPEFDIIFCRNVLIYFDRRNQYAILQKLCLQLKAGGFLLLGHSESITGLELPIVQIRPTIFRKK
jgi:chemotaxis protein methyltransferase CheR